MTYCLAIKLEDGLVYCSDSRTNAGADQVSSYSKLHRFPISASSSEICLLSAGNLGTTQAVVSAIRRDLQESKKFNLSSATYMSDIADYIGQLSTEMQEKYAPAGPNAGFDASASFIVGGQLPGQEPQVYMIYPQGNYITASKQHPFLQIGETKYGKPILERIIRNDTRPEVAMRCALVSMDSTMKSNVTVGPPIEVLFYPNNSTGLAPRYHILEENDPYLIELGKQWDEQIQRAFNDLPSLEKM